MTSHYNPEEKKNLRPRAEDWDVLEFLDTSRLARTGQMQRRMGWTQERTQERLRDFFDAGWVMKFPERTGFNNTKENIYGLTDIAARKLKQGRGFRLGPSNLKKCNAALLDTFGYLKDSAHTLGITELAARFHAGARATAGRVKFIDQPELFTLLPEETQRKSRPFGWQVTTPRYFPDPETEEEYYEDEWRQGVVLDRAMGLDLRYKDKYTWLFVEYYRDMALFRKNLMTQRSVMLKLLSLVRTRERQQLEGFVTERFGVINNNWRGLIILNPSPEKQEEINVANLLKYIDTYLTVEPGYAANMFLLADWQDLHPDNILLTPWRNGRGDIVQLIE